jgi:hypothetical protein
LLEVREIGLGQDEENWNDPYWVLQTPLGGGVARIGGVVAFFCLLISSIVYKPAVWFKGTSTKAS